MHARRSGRIDRSWNNLAESHRSAVVGPIIVVDGRKVVARSARSRVAVSAARYPPRVARNGAISRPVDLRVSRPPPTLYYEIIDFCYKYRSRRGL